MSRLKMTKSALAERRRQLATYLRALPSLELKRQQLVVELAAERGALAGFEAKAASLTDHAGELRFAADRDIAFESFVAISAIARWQESRLGIGLPAIGRVEWCEAAPGAEFPPWVDAAIRIVRDLAETRLRIEVALERAARLDLALRKTIQRINLLQQVLIPQARRDAAKIATFLADGQRMAIARTKLVVARRAARGSIAG